MRLLYITRWHQSVDGPAEVKKDSGRVLGLAKHPGRMTAGKIANSVHRWDIRGDIEMDELNTYPLGHYYCVQENAWMDGRCWGFYASEVLPREMDGPSMMLADNFDYHGKMLWQRKRVSGLSTSSKLHVYLSVA
ncbi:hypothetical protein PHMEG_00024598 [Phytophthora megakarya]|uniref:Uncharacterized protein n=1 Tax=Phytophthora megakarya TaxID=4795 RepID=A0A225VE21_9STRA|nr:hypothetical protein PHMEG_00024598 [Phytophthora megakarya]